MGRYRGSRVTKLSRETVIRAALDLLNEVGVDGLSTRRLAPGRAAARAVLAFQEQARTAGCAFPADAGRTPHSRHSAAGRALARVPARQRHELPARPAGLSRRCRIHAGTRPDGRRPAWRRSCACCGTPGSRRTPACMRCWRSATRWARCWSSRRRRTARAGHDPAGPAAGRAAAARRHGYTRRRRPGPGVRTGPGPVAGRLACRLEQAARPPARRNSKGNTQ